MFHLITWLLHKDFSKVLQSKEVEDWFFDGFETIMFCLFCFALYMAYVAMKEGKE